MGLLDKLLGRDAPERSQPPGGGGARSEDEQALERYRYLVRTAPPDRIEQAHEEAFAKLTPEQRRLALEHLTQSVPENEAATGDDPPSLARMATRAEMREPGTVERAFGGGGRGLGGVGGGMGMAAPLLGSFAAAFAGTLAAQALFSDLADGELFDSFDSGGDAGAGDAGGEVGGGDSASGDVGGFGGGDFGGDLGF
jgi:hypothetical protein